MLIFSHFSLDAKCFTAYFLWEFKKKKEGKKERKKFFGLKAWRCFCVVLLRLHHLLESVVGCSPRLRQVNGLDKDSQLQLICTLCCRLKRDMGKTEDSCDKGRYDSFSVSLCPFPPHCLWAPALFHRPPPLFFNSFFSSFLPPTCSASSPGDGCPQHLCSVSQMSHNRKWNINLAVDMTEKWWGGFRGASICLSSKGAVSIIQHWLVTTGKQLGGKKGKHDLLNSWRCRFFSEFPALFCKHSSLFTSEPSGGFTEIGYEGQKGVKFSFS